MQIVLGVVFFTVIVLALVVVILVAKSRLVASGDVEIEINGEKTIKVPTGGKLLSVLADNKLFVSSACGGGVVRDPVARRASGRALGADRRTGRADCSRRGPRVEHVDGQGRSAVAGATGARTLS